MTNIFDKFKSLKEQNSSLSEIDTAGGVEGEAETLQEAANTGISSQPSTKQFKERYKEVYNQGLEIFTTSKFTVASNISSFVSSSLYSESVFPEYYSNINTFKGNQLPQNSIEDKFRFVSKKYWSTRTIEGETRTGYVENSLDSMINVPFDIEFSQSKIKDDDDLPVELTQMILKPEYPAFIGVPIGAQPGTPAEFKFGVWKNYLKGQSFKITGRKDVIWDKIIDEDVYFEDNTHLLDKPVNDPEINSVFANIDPEYNFYSRKYENTALLSNIDEKILPNIQSNIAHIEYETNTDEDIVQFNTLNSRLDDVYSIVSGSGRLRGTSRLIDAWAREVVKVPLRERGELGNKFKHITFSLRDLEGEFMEETYKRSETFPMVKRISFKTDSSNEATQIFKDSKLTKNLTDFIVSDNIVKEELGLGQRNLQDFVVCDCFGTGSIYDDNIRAINISDYFEYIDSARIERLPEDEGRTDLFADVLDRIDSYSTFIDIIPDNESNVYNNKFLKSIAKAIFTGKMRTLLENRFRTFEEVLRGKEAYSETVLYRVTKHRVLSDNTIEDQPIQSFYFPNSNEVDVIKFADSQVKYGKEYVYKIFSYNLVFGSKYKYTNIVFDDRTKNAKVDIEHRPNVVIYETLFKQFDSRIVSDLPPTPPQVEFIPYLGIDDKVAISLNSSFGEIEEPPVQIEFSDEKPIFYMSKGQDKQFGEPLAYAGDDLIARFEIFRLTEHPSSYEDFENNKYAVVSTRLSEAEVTRTSEVTFVDDNINPNTKYYYIVRAVDIHGNLSNPGAVYEFEIVNDSGAVYPVVRVVDFKKTGENKKNRKTMRKFVRIKAADIQKIINLQKSGLAGVDSPKGKLKNLVLGEEEKSVWGRKFKVRFTSKNTGRKVDLNFSLGYDIKGFEFDFTSDQIALISDGGGGESITFSQALQLILIDQSDSLI